MRPLHFVILSCHPAERLRAPGSVPRAARPGSVPKDPGDVRWLTTTTNAENERTRELSAVVVANERTSPGFFKVKSKRQLPWQFRYFANVMKHASLLLSFHILLGSLLPHPDYTELSKLPQMYEHYQLHQRQSNGQLGLTSWPCTTLTKRISRQRMTYNCLFSTTILVRPLSSSFFPTSAFSLRPLTEGQCRLSFAILFLSFLPFQHFPATQVSRCSPLPLEGGMM
jgi:hypothetical protein